MAHPQTTVLIFYPHNFTQAKSGTQKRFIELLEYFHDRAIPVDVVTLNGYWESWTEAEARGQSRLVRRLFVQDWPHSPLQLLRKLKQRVLGKLPNYAIPTLKRQFRTIATQGAYTHVVVSYAYWANLVDDLRGVVTVLDLHDILTFNRFHQSGAAHFQLGRMLESELKQISKFQVALSISSSETSLLQSLCRDTRFVDVPMSFPASFQPTELPKHDILFAGGDNSFNRHAIDWFLASVLPLLPASTTAVIVGAVCNSINRKPDNVALVPFADSLSDYYRYSRIAICPMFGGSGLKIKVVEALAHGRPVVATDLGLVGLPDQAASSGCIRANTPETFANAIQTLLGNDTEYEIASQNAKAYFVRCFSRDRPWSNLDSIFTMGAGKTTLPGYGGK